MVTEEEYKRRRREIGKCFNFSTCVNHYLKKVWLIIIGIFLANNNIELRKTGTSDEVFVITSCSGAEYIKGS